MIKWLYFALAVVATAAVLFLLNDVRVQLKSSTATVNDKLPRILDKTEQTAETMAALSADVRDLRELAGLPQGGGRDATLVRYADRVLDAVAATGGQVGTEALIGKGLKSPQPAAEWVAGARKEAVWLKARWALSKRCSRRAQPLPLPVQEPLDERGEGREPRQTQHGFTNEQLEAIGGREEVDVPPRHPLRRLRPGPEPRLVRGGGAIDAGARVHLYWRRGPIRRGRGIPGREP